MNASQRKVAAITLAVIGVLCLLKGFSGVYVGEQDVLFVRVSSHWDWDQLKMGWLIGGVLLLGAAAMVGRGGSA